MPCMAIKEGRADYGAPVSMSNASHWSPNGKRGRHDDATELL